MLNRRTLLATAAAVPFANAHARLDLPDLRRDSLQLVGGDNVQIHSISPDGKFLVGLREKEQICFFDTENNTLLSESEIVPDLAAMDTTSIHWSPDSSRLAFHQHLHTRREDSDIFVVKASSADITNVTEDIQIDTTNQPADITSWPRMGIFPTWLDDSTMVFVTWAWNDEQRAVHQLVTIEPALLDGQISRWTDLEAIDVELLSSPPKLTPDGRFFFSAQPSGGKTQVFSIRDGEVPQQIEVADIQYFNLLDANDSHLILMDPANFVTWYVPLDDPSAMMDVHEVFEFENDEFEDFWPILGPEPDTVAIAQANNNRSILVHEAGKVREIAYLDGDSNPINNMDWVGDQILVAGETATWLLSTR